MSLARLSRSLSLMVASRLANVSPDWRVFQTVCRAAACLLLLAAAACTGRQLRPELYDAASGHGAAPARLVHAHPRRTAHAAKRVPSVVAVSVDADVLADADEKERLFRGFIDWQGAQPGAD